jgi:hypothetical protein
MKLESADDLGSPADLIDTVRYPVSEARSPRAAALLADLQSSLRRRGAAILPGFLRREAVDAIAAEVERLLPTAHREDTWGTPYLALPDESFPEGHPRRTAVQSITWVLAYDLLPRRSVARALYEWDPLMDFIAAVLGRERIHRFDDPMGGLNLTSMVDGDVQGWHYDSTDFVVSIGLRSSVAGGEFECAPLIRSATDESYDAVASILRGEAPDMVEVFPLVPGTMMIFEGRNSLHRVSPVRGAVSRSVMLLGYDTKPGTNSSDLLKMVRYGRTEARVPAER